MTATILIADDDPVQRRLLEAMVRRFGYETEVVEGGAEALSRLSAPDAKSIDLLILDLMMPDIDGISATTRITGRLPNTAVIMMSVQNEPDYLRRSMMAGGSRSSTARCRSTGGRWCSV